MKSPNLAFLLIFFMVLTLKISSLQALEQRQPEREQEDGENIGYEVMLTQESSASQSGVINRFLAQKKPKTQRVTCNKFPKICHAKGSPGPYCCKKKCVNVLSDRLHCGACGKKCKYNEICCRGECVNPSFSRKHCGGCNKRCSKGSLCVFGLCNYA